MGHVPRVKAGGEEENVCVYVELKYHRHGEGHRWGEARQNYHKHTRGKKGEWVVEGNAKGWGHAVCRHKHMAWAHNNAMPACNKRQGTWAGKGRWDKAKSTIRTSPKKVVVGEGWEWGKATQATQCCIMGENSVCKIKCVASLQSRPNKNLPRIRHMWWG